MTEFKIQEELTELINHGERILYVSAYQQGVLEIGEASEEAIKKLAEEVPDFRREYQIWYSRAFRCVRSLAPERFEEFEALYTGQKNAKELTYLTAGIIHFLQGIYTTRTGQENQDYFGKFSNGLGVQINILSSIKENVDHALFNLESEIQYGVLKPELDVALELKKQKQLRAAGAVSGVVIEEHLKLVCAGRGIKLRKKHPSIADFNESLKKESVIDLVMWRLIGRCADIRNYCVHSKERDPKPDEIDDIIRAAEKIISEVS